jgi:hypothetical protein
LAFWYDDTVWLEDAPGTRIIALFRQEDGAISVDLPNADVSMSLDAVLVQIAVTDFFFVHAGI